MKTLTVKLPQLHTTQAQIKCEARRFNVLCCGRRFGKDILGHDLLIATALSGKPTAWFAPTYRMMLDTYRELEKLLQPVITRANASDFRLELITRGVVDMWSLDSANTARGKAYARIIVNEAAIVANLQSAWNEVIRPTLADFGGDAFFLSTPRGINFFKTLYLLGKDGGEYAAWHFPTGANPFIAASEIEAMHTTMTERAYRQEVLAEFLEGEGAVFRKVREACVIERPDTPGQHQNHSFALGVDWGKQNDFTRLRVICRQCKRVVDWDGFNQIDFHFQRDRLKVLADRWRVDTILAESNSICEPNIEELRRDGLNVTGFETTATSKPPLIESLALALERGEIKLPQEDADELEAYEMKTNANTGRPTYSAPEGAHDDRVIADALALKAITSGLQILFEA